MRAAEGSLAREPGGPRLRRDFIVLAFESCEISITLDFRVPTSDPDANPCFREKDSLLDGPLRSNLEFGDSNFAPRPDSRVPARRTPRPRWWFLQKSRADVSQFGDSNFERKSRGLRLGILFFNSDSEILRKGGFCLPISSFERNSNRPSRCRFAAFPPSEANSGIEIHNQSFFAVARNYRARHVARKRHIVTVCHGAIDFLTNRIVIGKQIRGFVSRCHCEYRKRENQPLRRCFKIRLKTLNLFYL